MSEQFTQSQRRLNLLNYCKVDPITAARWYCLLNCHQWPPDFIMEKPPYYDADPEGMGFFLSMIFIHGIEALVPSEIRQSQWMGMKHVISDGLEEVFFPDAIGNMELVVSKPVRSKEHP